MQNYQPDEVVWATAQPVLDPANPSNRMTTLYVYTQAIVLETRPEQNQLVLGLKGGETTTLTFTSEEHEAQAIHRGTLPPEHEPQREDLLETLRRQQVQTRFRDAWNKAMKDSPLAGTPERKE